MKTHSRRYRYRGVVGDSLYDEVGEVFFVDLVDTFYGSVAGDSLLRPMYPEDLSESRRHLTLFLIQYWGGPPTYQLERGHPRLRLRHAPFPITTEARDAWLAAMTNALSVVGDRLAVERRAEVEAYFRMAAEQLRNV